MITQTLISSRPNSEKLFALSRMALPGGVNSPVRAFSGMNLLPLVAVEGEGSYVLDADGNRYLDFCGSWGALILGHAPPEVTDVAIDQVRKGSTFGITTPFEYELAREIQKHMPSLELVRCVSSGTEAVMSAIRLARGYTGREGILKFDGNYHGHSDSLLIQAGSGASRLKNSSSQGVPEDFVKHTYSLPYNDTEGVRAFLRSGVELAAVILEPVAGNMGVVAASSDFVQMLREETESIGALLIFDEVITGFRVGLGGAQELFGITPDLTCLGKVIGGGFPAAAFGGRSEIMAHLAPLGGVYQAGTLSGNPVAMRSGLATLKQVSKPGFYEELERKGRLFTEEIERVLQEQEEDAVINRVGSMFTLFFGRRHVERREALDEARYREFFCYLFERGIYFPPAAYEAAFISSAHTDEELKWAQGVVIDFLLKRSGE